jgi:DNA gyrase subunit A
VERTDGKADIMLFSNSGKCIRFAESDARSMGRVARGVIGIRLQKGQKVVSMLVLGEGDILTVTENGFGKRTSKEDHATQGRGGQGVIGIQTSERNGALVSAKQVSDDDDIMLISDGGTLVRTSAIQISTLGRNTQGVTLIRLRDGEKLVGLARIAKEEEGSGEADEDSYEAANPVSGDPDPGIDADSPE